MHISRETAGQTEDRLLRVLSQAEFTVFDGPYVFEEFPVDTPHRKIDNAALAFVPGRRRLEPIDPVSRYVKRIICSHPLSFPAGAG